MSATATTTTIGISPATSHARAIRLLRSHAGAFLAAGAWLVVWVTSLSRSLFDPIGFDQAFWQYVAERVMLGERMYVDIWDQNAPGVILVHCLSTWLAGTSPIALRLFDAGWQLATMGLLVSLACRDSRDWIVGWLAAMLYGLAYYAGGYVHTAQRDGFAVLPMLIALYVVARPPTNRTGNGGRFLPHLLAGVMGGFIFWIKPPLGACYGVLWLQCLVDGWRHRSQGMRAFLSLSGLTLGFVAAAGAGVGLLIHLGWWQAFVETMGRSQVPGYIRGPALLRELLPSAVGIICLLAGILAIARLCSRMNRVPRFPASATYLHSLAAAAALGMLLLTMRQWPEWQQGLLVLAGLLIPAFGAAIAPGWRERSRTERIILWMALACVLSIVLQGHFFLYHFVPLIACASLLSARTIVAAIVPRSPRQGGERPPMSAIWPAVCAACLAYLVLGCWWPKMTFHTSHPYVLAGSTLNQHYDRVTRHKTRYPRYSTTQAVADRVRALTGEHEAIACLLNEPRIYYLARRPAAHGLVIPNAVFHPLFDDFLQTIERRRPVVLLARLPENVSASAAHAEITSAVFAEAAAFFGPAASRLAHLYRVTETIDDVCILRPADPPGG